HPFPDAAISRPDVLTKNPSLPGRRVAQTLEDLDGGRLARAVRAEEGEHLAAGHVKVDPVDGRDGAIWLDEPAALDHLLVHGQHPRRSDIARSHGVFV